MAIKGSKITIVFDTQGNPSLEKANKSIDQQNQKINQNTKSKKVNERQSTKNNAVEKSLYQTTLNSTKGFSKQAREMGGSSGLVAAYATLAANVFAATAAFGALQRAAQFENLSKGLSELGQQSGRTLSIMAEGLREVTGGAISAEESMRAAALGVSGGFGGAQLEGLAKIAKGASITLGRSLPDAFDRLTRGAIKLEPEILDELGIMVRLDDAVENYAAEIGKAGSALTQMERRQAFMNAILEQGEGKFGEIADAVEPDVYSQLGATFADLTKDIFGFFNDDVIFGFAGLSDIVKVLADNTLMLFGVMTLFGSTIAGKMIPALGNAASAAAHFGEEQLALAASTEAQAAAQIAQRTALIGKGMEGVASKTYIGLAKGLEHSKDKMGDMMKMQKSLNASTVYYQKIKATGDAKEAAHASQKLALLQAEKVSLSQLIALESGKGAAALASANATSLANAQLGISKTIISLTNKEMKMGAAWKAISAATAMYTKELQANTAAQVINGFWAKTNSKIMIFLKAQVFRAAASFQVLKVAMLSVIAPLGIAILLIGAFIAAWRHFTMTEELEAYNKGMEDLNKLFDEMEEKVSKYHNALSQGKDLAAAQLRAFEIQSGMITEINEKLKEQIKLAEEANKSKKGDGDVRFDAGFFDRRNASQFAGAFARGDTAILMDSWKELAQSLTDSGIAEDANKTFLENMFMVKGSPELTTFQKVMNSDIPKQAEFMKKKLADIASDKSIKSAEELAEALQRGVAAAAAQFGALGPATKEFQQGLQEANKSASQFLTGFAKSTKVDAFAKSTSAAVKNLDAMKQAAAEAGEEVAHVVGLQLLNVGGQIASMLGPEFQAAQKEAKAAGMALEKAVTKAEKSAAQVRIDEAAEVLSGFEEDFKLLNKDLLETQRLLQNTKIAIDANKKSLSFVKKAYKDIASLAGQTNKLERQNLNYQQDLAIAKVKQLKATFDGIKVLTGQDDKGDDIFEIMSNQELMNKTLEEQRAIIDQTNLDQGQFNELKAANLDIALRNVELEKNAAMQSHVANQQRIEAMMKQVDLQKKLIDQTHEMAKLDAQIANFRKKGKSDLNAKQEAEFKVAAAQSAAKHALDTLEMEEGLIDTKMEIQRIEMENLNKRAEILNKELELKGDDRIQLLDVNKAMADLQKAANFQKQALENNVVMLKKKVVVAMDEGALAMKGAFESGDIGVFEAMRGVAEMMKGGEVALEDSKKAENFFDAGLQKGSLFTHDISMEKVLNNVKLSLSGKMDQMISAMADSAAHGANPYGSLPIASLFQLMDMGAFKEVNAEKKLEEAKIEGDTFNRKNSEFFGTSGVTAKARFPMTVTPEPTITKGEGFTGENTVNATEEKTEATMNWRAALLATDIAMSALNQNLKDFGAEGEAMMGFRSGMSQMAGAMLDFKEASGENKLGERLAATGAFIGGISQMIQNSAKGAVAQIDKLIAAEKKKDGKSKASLEKIKGMEAKKTAIQKKAFEQNKKAQIAQTAINTASAAMAAYKDFGMPIGAIMAAMIVAMGAKQISMISKQQFQGGGETASGGIQAITVGKRSNKVDVSQKASAGELAYLKGDKGVGTNANNFQPMGGAAGLRKGYASGGVLVGEQGPEVIEPMSGFNVIPNDALGGKPVEAHITINAIDAQGVEEVLLGQQGNIISMIRSAANDYGQEFLESVETDHLVGSPKSAGGIDY